MDELVSTATNIAILAVSMIYTYNTFVPARENTSPLPFQGQSDYMLPTRITYGSLKYVRLIRVTYQIG